MGTDRCTKEKPSLNIILNKGVIGNATACSNDIRHRAARHVRACLRRCLGNQISGDLFSFVLSDPPPTFDFPCASRAPLLFTVFHCFSDFVF